MNKSLSFNNSTANSLLIKQLGIISTGTEETLLNITLEWIPQKDFPGIVLEDDILLSDFLRLLLLVKVD